MPHRAIESLPRLYRDSTAVSYRFTPHQLGVPRTGQFGFFRDRHAGLWDGLVLPLLADRPAGTQSPVAVAAAQ